MAMEVSNTIMLQRAKIAEPERLADLARAIRRAMPDSPIATLAGSA